MTKFEPITEERLKTGDNLRVQVNLQSRRERLLWGILHAAISTKSKGLAADVRDGSAPAIIARYLDMTRDLVKQEQFKFILNSVIKELCPDEAIEQEVIDILVAERIL